MLNLEWISKLGELLRALPSWMLVALALTGFALLFLPAFGGADLIRLRHDYGWMPWCLAVSMTIFAAAKFTGFLVLAQAQSMRVRKARTKRCATNRYHSVYLPLEELLVPLHVSTFRSMDARHLRDRALNAFHELRKFRGRPRTLRRAWKALGDHKTTGPTGAMDYGDVFPRDAIKQLIYRKLAFCDQPLIILVKRADRDGIELRIHPTELSEADCALIEHIQSEGDRLRLLLGK